MIETFFTTYFIFCMLALPFIFLKVVFSGSKGNYNSKTFFEEDDKPKSYTYYLKKYPQTHIDIEVNPVSDGDEIVYAKRKKEGGCIAKVENKLKGYELYVEADCPYNLRNKIREIFKAWPEEARIQHERAIEAEHKKQKNNHKRRKKTGINKPSQNTGKMAMTDLG